MGNEGNEEGIGLLSGGPTEPPAKKPGAPTPGAAPGAAPAPAPTAPKPDAATVLALKAADDTSRAVTAGTVTTLSAVLTSRAVAPLTANLAVEVGYTSTYAGEGAEWPVSWMPPGKRASVELFPRKENYSIELAPNTGVPLSYTITAPVGVRYGDQVEVRLSATTPEGGAPVRLTLACVARQAVLAIKTSRGYERE
ncbi:MAG TPA: hypothetical protein VEH28_09100, partial [Thermoplasmata archaeon]|nr:hypothetical protein [Thermoplasmata archaeon]